MAVDVSNHDLISEVQKKKCDCIDMISLATLLDWSLFEITTPILLCLIFFWIACGDGITHVKNILKKRSTEQERLQREILKARKKQQKLESKEQTLRESAVDIEVGAAATAVACAEEVPKIVPFSAT